MAEQTTTTEVLDPPVSPDDPSPLTAGGDLDEPEFDDDDLTDGRGCE